MKKRAAKAKKAKKAKKGTKASKATVGVVGIDSNYELATRLASRFRTQHVYPYLRAQGLAIKRLQGKRARRDLVENAVTESGVAYLTGSGHGEVDLYSGDGGQTVFGIGTYKPAEAAGKIVHFLSCYTANALGPDFVVNGALAYFGYSGAFTFDTRIAADFLACDAEIDRGFADGFSAKEVHARTMAAFDAAIQTASAQKRDWAANILQYNRDHLCGPTTDGRLGKPAARLV